MQRINPETGKSNFYMALHAAMTLQMRKLVSSPKDLVGVLLFNTVRVPFLLMVKVSNTGTHCIHSVLRS